MLLLLLLLLLRVRRNGSKSCIVNILLPVKWLQAQLTFGEFPMQKDRDELFKLRNLKIKLSIFFVHR